MGKTKVLIIGAAGFLGKHLAKDLSKRDEVFCADRHENIDGLFYLDLSKRDLVKEAFLRARPELVLLPASITGVDFCEKNQDLAWKINAEGPKDVAVAAKKCGAFLVFYSSDYVFDGARGPYSEDARPNPLNIYGKTKLEAERIIEKELKRFLIIRTCSIYGFELDGLNYAMQILRGLKDRKTINAVCDQYGTPTYVEDLSNVTLELVKNKKEGIFNVVGPDCVNRVQFANEAADIFNLDKGLIRGVTTDELKQAAARPKRGGLKIDKLIKELGIRTMSLRDGLIAMKERGAIKVDKEK